MNRIRNGAADSARRLGGRRPSGGIGSVLVCVGDARRAHGRSVEVHAVGDDAVAPAEEAPGGPGGGLGDGDADVQAVHPPPPAERDGRERRW